MLESLNSCPNPCYSHIVHSPEGFTILAPQLNYITDIVLELKEELAKIKSWSKGDEEAVSSDASIFSQQGKT